MMETKLKILQKEKDEMEVKSQLELERVQEQHGRDIDALQDDFEEQRRVC